MASLALRTSLITGVSFWLAACGVDDDVISCTANLVPGIVVEIRDSNTNAPLAENSLVVITSQNYSETLTLFEREGADLSSTVSVAGAFERPGIYDINLSLSGYNGWSSTGVEVTAGVCHVGTVRLTATLNTL